MIIKHRLKTDSLELCPPEKVYLSERFFGFLLWNTRQVLYPQGPAKSLTISSIPCVSLVSFVPTGWFTVYYDGN